VRGTRAALIALVLGAGLAVPALVVADDPATTTTETQTTTAPTVGGAPADTAPATDTVQTEPPSAAKSTKHGLAGAAQAAPRKQSPTASASAGAEYPVDMTQQLNFDPKTLTVKVGDKVTWRNTSTSDLDHTATANDGSFDSGTVHRNKNFSHTFGKAGTFKYFCTFHGSRSGNGMAGTIKVEASGGSSGSGGTPSSGGTSGSGGSNGSTGSTSGSGTPASSATTGSSGSLPSTGADLLVLALLGGDLLLAGLVLREALAARRDYS
jgi:plastocyanin